MTQGWKIFENQWDRAHPPQVLGFMLRRCLTNSSLLGFPLEEESVGETSLYVCTTVLVSSVCKRGHPLDFPNSCERSEHCGELGRCTRADETVLWSAEDRLPATFSVAAGSCEVKQREEVLVAIVAANQSGSGVCPAFL